VRRRIHHGGRREEKESKEEDQGITTAGTEVLSGSGEEKQYNAETRREQ
jgi:hypothetical protein